MNNTNICVVTILVSKGHTYARLKVHMSFRMLFSQHKIQPLLELITIMMKYFYDQFCTVNVLPIVAKEQKYIFLIDGLYCIGGCVVYLDAKASNSKRGRKCVGYLLAYITCRAFLFS
jgi:hypothetical protein